MKVKAQQLSEIFDQLISGERSREDVAEWANDARHASDMGELLFEPATDEQRMWDAIIYLTGVDLKTSATRYLHNEADFREYRMKLNL